MLPIETNRFLETINQIQISIIGSVCTYVFVQIIWVFDLIFINTYIWRDIYFETLPGSSVVQVAIFPKIVKSAEIAGILTCKLVVFYKKRVNGCNFIYSV